MRWTEDAIGELKALCFDEVSNADIAKFFDVPVTEIRAKRSQLGITIPKVRAAKGKPGMTVNPEFEAAVVEAEKLFPRRLPKAIKSAFSDLGTAILLKMANNGTSVRDAKIYCALSDDLIALQDKYEKLLAGGAS